MYLFVTRIKMKAVVVMLSFAFLLVVVMEGTESRRLDVSDLFEGEEEAVDDERPLKRCKHFGGCQHDWDCCSGRCYYGHC